MLPNVDRALIEDAKVRDYLLSGSHPVGRFKSVVFSALGYTQYEWMLLAVDLLALARSHPATAEQTSAHGQKYVVSGKLSGPNGRTGQFKTIWLVRTGEDFPRFVTALPE